MTRRVEPTKAPRRQNHFTAISRARGEIGIKGNCRLMLRHSLPPRRIRFVRVAQSLIYWIHIPVLSPGQSRTVRVGPGRKSYVLCALALVTGLISASLRPGVTCVTADTTTWFTFSRSNNTVGTIRRYARLPRYTSLAPVPLCWVQRLYMCAIARANGKRCAR